MNEPVTPVTVYTEEDQRSIFNQFAEQAGWANYVFAGKYMDQIITLAEKRMFSDIGIGTYADRAFHKTNEELWRDSMEEHADSVVYRMIRIARDAGALQ